jgi:hypothetical protein
MSYRISHKLASSSHTECTSCILHDMYFYFCTSLDLFRLQIVQLVNQSRPERSWTFHVFALRGDLCSNVEHQDPSVSIAMLRSRTLPVRQPTCRLVQAGTENLVASLRPCATNEQRRKRSPPVFLSCSRSQLCFQAGHESTVDCIIPTR